MKVQNHCEEILEGGECPECKGVMAFPPVENCSCHISPPCHACTSNLLTCSMCGLEQPIPLNEEKYRLLDGCITEYCPTQPTMELGNGKRIFDYDYDSSSGSTMVYRGSYKGDVTPQDIINAFGSGTFGHRGPTMNNGRFTYTLITD